MWATSVSSTWRAISPRPFRRVQGEKKFKRGTLDFLKETQKYINTIRKPIVDQSLVEGGTVATAHPSNEDAKLQETRRNKPLSAVQSPHSSFSKEIASPRVASLPRLLSLAGVGKDRSCLVQIHTLVPFSSQKPRHSHNASKFLQTEAMQYVRRFDLQQGKRDFRLKGYHLHRRVVSDAVRTVSQ